jgi:DGQHR domain-containing protein
MKMSEAMDRFGTEVEIDHCILGGNLNLVAVRGFARLDLLAAISRPDVFDQVRNPLGTQRELQKSHASQAIKYATEAMGVGAETDPRAFPEVILNARDRAVVSIFDREDSAELDVMSAGSDAEFEPRAVSLRIDLQQLAAEQEEESPAISRVDGNHRLSQAVAEVDDPHDSFPVVPFAMFVGLTDDQERALFRDINGNQKPMQTAHLDSIRIRLEATSGRLLQDESGRALWFAQQLAQPGRAFEGLVFFGGSARGARAESGKVPPVKINTLKSAIQTTLRDASRLELEFRLNNRLDEDGMIHIVDQDDADQVLELLDTYWKAVRDAFSDAWQDRRGHILLQSIGITAFSRLAADVIEERVFDKQAVEQEDFDVVMQAIASKVSLRREEFPGIAGLAGAKVVYQKLLAARTPDTVAVQNVRSQLRARLGQEGSPLD